MIEVVDSPIDTAALAAELRDLRAGAYASFEGWVRNHNDGHDVLRLEYEAYGPLCKTEGEKIVAEAMQRFPFYSACVVHREGMLELGDCAVWVGVVSKHRDEAFRACRYIIDELKVRLPIWKKEYYADGDSGWVNCERCAAHGHRPRAVGETAEIP
jgi:molybdopterin synthase catalytic subunit